MNAFHVALLIALSGCLADAESFLINRKSSLKSQITGSQLQSELTNAMGEALGCGGHVSKDDIVRTEQQLMPLWRTLPKNGEGNVDRRSLRNAIHRHFTRRWAIQIRGFEPSRLANATGWGSDDILGQRVPAYVESVLESQHKLAQGFTINDAAYMVVTIEQLIFDWEGALLEQIYADTGKSLTRSLGFYGLARVLESYVITWLLRTDADTTFLLMQNRSLLEHSVPHWSDVRNLIRGSIRALERRRRMAPLAAMKEGIARDGHNALSSEYSFEDAHAIVASMRQSFGSFWNSECASLKTSLLGMDVHQTGRVPLSKFHGTGMEADWRFGESEAYLRELGALDETSWQGKQVIISNYMQAATNCVVSTPHYLVCCLNDCEPLLGEIEAEIGAPSADPKVLLEVVRGMNAQATLDDDLPHTFRGSLPQQLQQIAAVHGGTVPLHGRLFAQWLHYAFPRECAFPHKEGTVATTPPSEYGAEFYATPEEMRQSANATSVSASSGSEHLEWLSEWSPEEELGAADMAVSMQAPWERRGRGGMMVAAAVFLAAAAVLAHLGLPLSKQSSTGLPVSKKQHYV